MARQDAYWFKAKRYGWGWYPASWQGALILVGYMLLALAGSVWFQNQLVYFAAFFAGLTVVLIYICYKTGEKPYWRWGVKD